MSNTENGLISRRQEVLRVVAYNEYQDFHLCRDANGKTRRVDLHVDGADIPDGKDLVGCSVQIDGCHSYIEIATGVALCDNPDDLTK